VEGVDVTDEENTESLSDEEIKKENLKLLKHLNRVIGENTHIFVGMRKKIEFTYNVTVFLYIVLFSLGVLLLLVPVISGLKGDIATFNSLLSGSLGITNIIVLFTFKPVEKIHNLMSEMGQLTIITSSYQEQGALRLLELDANKKHTVGKAADSIYIAAEKSVKLLEDYCEIKDKTKKPNEDVPQKPDGDVKAP
jgi:hypothetical protein